MDEGLQNLLTEINDLESKNRLISMQIREASQTEKELQKTEKELLLSTEQIDKELKDLEHEKKDLINDITRVDLICKNIETTLISEHAPAETIAQKRLQVEEYIENKEKTINKDLTIAEEKIKNCLSEITECDQELDTLKKIKNEHLILNLITIEELYEIYEETKETYQDNSFKKQCEQITTEDYKNHSYFCNPTHLLHMINLLSEKIKLNSNDPDFNIESIADYFGLKKEKVEETVEEFGLAELNRIMINHYNNKIVH